MSCYSACDSRIEKTFGNKMRIVCNRLRLSLTSTIAFSLTGIAVMWASLSITHFFKQASQVYVASCPFASFTTVNRIQFENSSDYLHHYPEFVCPQNFRNLADWIYGWPSNVFEEDIEYFKENSNPLPPNLLPGSILYVKTDRLSLFFTQIYPQLTNHFVLITGQGDDSTPSIFLDYLEKSDSKIIHWFGQNGDIDPSRSRKFTHIPIGEPSLR
jgi:hypothetical protein